jgi:hypothetical protein
MTFNHEEYWKKYALHLMDIGIPEEEIQCFEATFFEAVEEAYWKGFEHALGVEDEEGAEE